MQSAECGLGIQEIDNDHARFELPEWQRLMDWLEKPALTDTHPEDEISVVSA